MTIISFFFLNFRINWLLTTCCWLKERSENPECFLTLIVEFSIRFSEIAFFVFPKKNVDFFHDNSFFLAFLV